MYSSITDRKGRRIPAGARRGLARAGLAAGLLLALLIVVLAGGNTTAASARQEKAREGNGVSPGDLRCLTRRPQDCLAEPAPVDEPHGADCATCHSLWERGGTAGMIRSCTDRDCHPDAAALTAFHASVRDATLADCTACHTPHAFRVSGSGTRCTVCHEGGGRAAIQASVFPAHRFAEDPLFRHGDHTAVACTVCHAARDVHGELKVGPGDCRSCHHGSSLAEDCARCHSADETRTLSFTVTRKLDIRIGSVREPARTLLFEHARHETAPCRTCHTGPDVRAATRQADCSGCHFEHHQPTADCSACHEPPAAGAHDRLSHLGCGGTGCHDPLPPGIEQAPRTRQLCLACHTGYADHRPGRNCADCHVLPPPGTPVPAGNR